MNSGCGHSSRVIKLEYFRILKKRKDLLKKTGKEFTEDIAASITEIRKGIQYPPLKFKINNKTAETTVKYYPKSEETYERLLTSKKYGGNLFEMKIKKHAKE